MQDQPATPSSTPAEPSATPPAAGAPAAPAAPAGSAPPPSPPVPAPAPAAVPIAAVARTQRGGRLLNIALGGAVVLAIAGVAFAVGRFTAPPAVTAGSFPNGGPGQFFRNGQGREGFAGGLDGGQGQGGQGGRGTFLAGGGITLEGTVESVTDTTLTLKTDSGQTIQIALDGSTTYHSQTDASASDVTAGGKVLVRLGARGGFGAGPQASAGTDGAATGPAASDITVVP